MGQVREFLSVKTALQAAGAGVTRALIGADKRSGRARLAIAGGSAAQALAHVTLPDDVRARLRLTWVDERCVAVTDKDSNRGAAERAGLLPRGGAVTLPLWHDGETPGQACARVAAGLAAEFAGGLDVALLGLGEDGHIASLFPGHPVLLATEPVAHVGDSPKPPADRMTLTLPILRRAGLCVLVATGEGKRAALTRLRRGDDALPATGLERLVVITDLELPDFLAI